MSSLEPLCNFRRNPCSLELTASVVSAAVLCRRAAMMNPTNPPEKVQEIIALPPAIEKKIERFMPIVKAQIESYIEFYDGEVFSDELGNPATRAQEYIHVLVWWADGTINEEETAREMLKQDDLNAEEKYRIACNHCLENEIKTLRSNLKTEIDLRKAKRYCPLVYYWESICRNGKTTGLTEYFADNVFDTEYYMYPFCAADYFLNSLNLEKQIDLHQTRCLKEMPFKSWETFLMKLSNEQLTQLVKDLERGESRYYKPNLLDYLLHFWMHADFLVQIWMRIRDEYPLYAFQELIVRLLKCEYASVQSTDHITLAVEIFNLAPYELQRGVSDYYTGQSLCYRVSNLTDVRLDVAILRAAGYRDKLYKFWLRKWIYLFENYPTDCFVQFMNVCCAEEGSEKFKMKVMKMGVRRASERCNTLFTEMRFSELDQFLSVFSSDPSRIMKTKQMILRNVFLTWDDWIENNYHLRFPPPNQLVDFIEGSFDDIRSANEFKMEVLSSSKFLYAFYYYTGSNMFDWVKDAIWLCSYNDDDFKMYKNKFLQLRFELAKASELDISDAFYQDPGWMSFLEWCSDES